MKRSIGGLEETVIFFLLVFLIDTSVSLCVCPPPRCSSDLPSGPCPAYRLQSYSHVHAEPWARPPLQHAVLDTERDVSAQQHLQRGEPWRPQCHRSQPQRLPAAVWRQPRVSWRRWTRPGRFMSLCGQWVEAFLSVLPLRTFFFFYKLVNTAAI